MAHTSDTNLLDTVPIGYRTPSTTVFSSAIDNSPDLVIETVQAHGNIEVIDKAKDQRSIPLSLTDRSLFQLPCPRTAWPGIRRIPLPAQAQGTVSYCSYIIQIIDTVL